MGTRWKKFSRSRLLKVLALAVMLGCMAAGVYYAAFILQFSRPAGMYDYLDAINRDNFEKSAFFRNDMRRRIYFLSSILEAANTGEDREITAADIEWYKTRAGDFTGQRYSVKTNVMSLYNSSEVKEIYKSCPVYLILEKGAMEYSGNLGNYYIDDMLSFYRPVAYDDDENSREYERVGLRDVIGEGEYLYFAVTAEEMDALRREYQRSLDAASEALVVYGGLLLLTLIAFIYLLVVAGRRNDGDAVYLTRFDRLQLDVVCVALALPFAFFFAEGYRVIGISDNPNYQFIAGTLLLSAGYILAMAFILSVVKNIKKRTILKNTLIYQALKIIARFLSAVARFFKDAASLPPLTLLWPVGTVVCGLLIFSCGMIFWVAFPIGALIIIGAAVWVTRCAHRLAELQKVTGRIKDGELTAKADEKRGISDIDRLAENINRITGGLERAVSGALRSERMKAELITNVSHDLRTPLTSIISFSGLLQSEGLDAPDAPHYLDVICQKAKRMQTLTDDLFEISRAQSGNLEPVFETVGLQSLVRQSLGELAEKVQSSGLYFRLSGEEAKVRADGKMMWRVAENLLNNIFKYALPNSRVYIETKLDGGRGVLVMRNISACEITATADELAERFVRGEEARSSEGSGLGLAIVGNFVRLQGGVFSLDIDGDLFKTTLSLPLAEQERGLS